MPILNHWALLPRTSGSEQAQSTNFVLCGYIEEHPQAKDGLVTTSPVMEIAADGTWARTKSRVYGLGEPDAYFMQLLEKRGLTLGSLITSPGSAFSI